MKKRCKKFSSMTEKEERYLRVCSKHRPTDYKAVPELRLTGKWFRELGFDIGDRVNITTREKLIIIQPVKEG
jgi:hypothetical protein